MRKSKQVHLTEAIDVSSHSGSVGLHADLKLAVAICGSASSDYVVHNASWGYLSETCLLTHVERQTKGGPAIIFAEMREGRSDQHAHAVSALAYEIDGKLQVDQVKRVLETGQREAVLWTTHNHLRTHQEVTWSRFARWHLREYGVAADPTDKTVVEFCAQDKRYNHLVNVRLTNGGKKHRVKAYGNWVDVFDIAHDPEHKVRIVFPLRVAIPLKTGLFDTASYKALYHAHGARTFGDAYSTESSNPSRVHYLPSHKPGHTHGAHHFSGELLDPIALWNEIKDGHLKRPAQTTNKVFSTVGLDELEHVLKSIPPDLEYPDWFRCLAAIFHETGGGERGNALAHEWSSGDGRYDFEEVERIWDSFDPDRANPATMGTLVKLAREHDPKFKPFRSIRQGFRLLHSMIERYRNERPD